MMTHPLTARVAELHQREMRAEIARERLAGRAGETRPVSGVVSVVAAWVERARIVAAPRRGAPVRQPGAA
jgi:hypothetical protein